MNRAEVLIIGAGIAGVSLAGALASQRKAVVLERETHPAYHSTGRSAAYYAPAYGNDAVRLLTVAGQSFFEQPPSDFSPHPIFRRRHWVHIARPDQSSLLERKAGELAGHVEQVSAAELERMVPILRPDHLAIGLLDRRGGDLDVDAIMQGYLRRIRACGSELVCGAQVEALSYARGHWTAETRAGSFSAPIVVNAAGAWADEIAQLAGLEPLNLMPKRRTAILVAAPDDIEIGNWPLVADIEEQFYFKPDAGQILVSPADESPSPPCDAQAEELDVAIAVDRFERATTVKVARVNHRWAGLRVFAPDRTPIAGFDPRCEGFFWLAGQGGYGVQTAPGLSQLAAGLLSERKLAAPFDMLDRLVPQLSPARFIV